MMNDGWMDQMVLPKKTHAMFPALEMFLISLFCFIQTVKLFGEPLFSMLVHLPESPLIKVFDIS